MFLAVDHINIVSQVMLVSHPQLYVTVLIGEAVEKSACFWTPHTHQCLTKIGHKTGVYDEAKAASETEETF